MSNNSWWGAIDLALLACRFLLAGIFLVAGAAKLADAADFATAVANYQLLPERFVGLVAAWLPRLELAGGILLALGVMVAPASAALSLMLLVLTLAVSINLLRGREMDCGCLGQSAPRKITWWTVGRNLALLAMGVGVSLRPPSALALLPDWGPGLGMGSRGTVATTDALAILVATTVALITLRMAVEGVRLKRAARAFSRARKETIQ